MKFTLIVLSMIMALSSHALTSEENLGKILFFEPLLSGSNIMSCATCHNPSLGWSDGLAKSVGHGHQTLQRRTPTIINSKMQKRFFWDGRAATLEEQALGPIQSPGEMNQNLSEAIEELSAIEGYKLLFSKIYPMQGITADTIANAIAAYERTIVSGDTPYDRWRNGDHSAMSASAIRGQKIFNGPRGMCFKCHKGANLSDGLLWDIALTGSDLGQGGLDEFAHHPMFKYRFKTPTLWGVAQRSPYMHDGSLKTLEEVVDHYNNGGNLLASEQTEQRIKYLPHRFIKPLGLTAQDKEDLVHFLKALSSPPTQVTFPILPR